MGFQLPPEARLADRRRLLLTLGAPYALLFLASLTAWPWRALEIPGVIGTLTPPSFLFLAATVAASTVALRRRLPLSMITWLPAGQGAIVLLATGFFTVGPQDELTGLAFLLAYGVVFLIVLAVTTAIASHGGPLAVSFISLFVFTQAARFPVFEADAPASIEGATPPHLRRRPPCRRRNRADGLARAPPRRSRRRLSHADRPFDCRPRRSPRAPRQLGGPCAQRRPRPNRHP